MKFTFRRVVPFLSASLEVNGNTSINLGLLNDEERIAMAISLREAADDLLSGIDPENLQKAGIQP